MSPRARGAAVAALSIGWLVVVACGARTGLLTPCLAVAAGCALAFAFFVDDTLSALAALPARRQARDALLGLALGGVTLAATYGLYPVARGLWPPLADEVRSLYSLMQVTRATAPLIALVIVAEEMLWRGVLLEALQRTGSSALAAALLSSLLYGAAQLGLGVPMLGLAALLLGVVWALTTLFTRGRVAALVAHALWTFTVLGAVPLEHAR